MDNGPGARVPFPDDHALQFPRGAAGGPHAAARRPIPSGGDRGDRFFRSPQRLFWPSRADHASEEEEDGDDADDEDEDDDDPDEGDGFVSVDENNIKNNTSSNNNNNNNSSGSVQSSSENLRGKRARSHEHHSSFGTKEKSDEHFEPGRTGNYEGAITVVQPEQYYSSVLHEGDGPDVGQKETGTENGCNFGGGKEIGLLVDCGESVRMHLSDPITGALMDDAVILACGHSFGSGGMQHVYRMKACCKCAQPISEDSVRPNLALRAAVVAFRREEESQSFKASKRKRDRFEQEKCGYDDSFPVELSRGKGVQFPFIVSDRVLIKGNKRTPERFVGRVAVVTTQCLNGWYVVKTLDNAESVKLQYRSLAKVTDDPSSNMTSNKALAPSWL